MSLMVLSLFGFYGVITNDTTWSDTAYLTGDVWVDSGVTLTIAPGTVVLYADTCVWDTAWYAEGEEYPKTGDGSVDIIIQGNLKAVGTEEDSIYFRFAHSNNYIEGTIVMTDGWDSLSNTSIGSTDSWMYIFLYRARLEMVGCRCEHGRGIFGLESDISLNGCEFVDNFSRGVFSQDGKLNINNCNFFRSRRVYVGEYLDDYPFLYYFGAVICGVNLDSGIVTHSKICDAVGVSMEKIYSGWQGAGCIFLSCGSVEISDCVLDSIQGGWGGDESMGAPPGSGGDGLGICLVDCSKVLIEGNKILHILGGHGGIGEFEDGPYGNSRPFVCYNSDPVITNNEFNSYGTYIYVDSTSQPIIGGASGKGNRFLEATARDYVIHNDSPNDIDATWNFWECPPSLIDSLIFDYYDDSTKGIVRYDDYQGVEEKQEVAAESFSIGSTIAYDMLTISFESDLKNPVTVELFDISGRKVLSQSVCKSRESINVSALSSGIYFVIARVDGGKMTRKVIIR